MGVRYQSYTMLYALDVKHHALCCGKGRYRWCMLALGELLIMLQHTPVPLIMHLINAVLSLTSCLPFMQPPAHPPAAARGR